jgi:hypothetical protein
VAKKKSKWDRRVPFDANGDMVSFVRDPAVKEWRDAEPFEAEIEFLDFDYRYHNRPRALVRNKADGKIYRMAIGELGRALQGSVLPWKAWTFGKRGQNFTLKAVDKPKPKCFRCNKADVWTDGVCHDCLNEQIRHA